MNSHDDRPRNHESTKPWFDTLTTGACPELVEGCFRGFVFSWRDLL